MDLDRWVPMRWPCGPLEIAKGKRREHRDQDCAAADTEHAGEKSGHRAHRHQQKRQFEKLGDIKPGDCHPGLFFLSR